MQAVWLVRAANMPTLTMAGAGTAPPEKRFSGLLPFSGHRSVVIGMASAQPLSPDLDSTRRSLSLGQAADVEAVDESAAEDPAIFPPGVSSFPLLSRLESSRTPSPLRARIRYSSIQKIMSANMQFVSFARYRSWTPDKRRR